MQVVSVAASGHTHQDDVKRHLIAQKGLLSPLDIAVDKITVRVLLLSHIFTKIFNCPGTELAGGYLAASVATIFVEKHHQSN